MLALPLSFNGIVPVSFTLSCIALYSRLSWHIVLLSTIPIALSTLVLVSTFIWVRVTLDLEALDVGNVTTAVCGSKSVEMNNANNVMDVKVTFIWLVYTYCIVWAFWCLLMQIFKNVPKESPRARLLARLKNFNDQRLGFISSYGLAKYGYAISLVVWGFCFGYHFY